MKTYPFDPEKYLDSDEAIAEYLATAFETHDPAFVVDALRVSARARGMSQIARDASVTREALYKSRSQDGDPRLTTLLGVTKSLGMKLSVSPADEPTDV